MKKVGGISKDHNKVANPYNQSETFIYDGNAYTLVSFHDENRAFCNAILTCDEFDEEENEKLHLMVADIQNRILAGTTFEALIDDQRYQTAPRTKDIKGHLKIEKAWDLRDAVLQILRMRYEVPADGATITALKPKPSPGRTK